MSNLADITAAESLAMTQKRELVLCLAARSRGERKLP
jgi:hypothetical protein